MHYLQVTQNLFVPIGVRFCKALIAALLESHTEKASTQPATVCRVALHQRYGTLDPGIHGGAPRHGELGVLRGAVREALREQTVRAHRAEDGGELHRRELGAARLRQPLGNQRAEQPRLQPWVVDTGQEAATRAGHRGPWYGGFGPAAGAEGERRPFTGPRCRVWGKRGLGFKGIRSLFLFFFKKISIFPPSTIAKF